MRHVLHFTRSIHTFAGKILYLNLIGMTFISLFEGVGIFLLIPLINLTGVLKLHSEKIIGFSWLNGIFQKSSENVGLTIILSAYVFLIVGQGIFQRNQTILNARIQQGYMRHLRDEMYKSFIQANWGFFLTKRKSDIINVMTTEISRVSSGTQLFLQFLSSLVFTLIQIGLALWLSPRMTISVLLLGAALIFFSRKFIKKSSLLGEETVQLAKTYFAGITDHFNGIKDIKSNTLEEIHCTWVRSMGLKLERNVLEMIKLNTSSQLIFKVMSAVLVAVFVFFAIKMFQAQGPQLMLIIVIFTRIWPRLSIIQSNLQQIWGVIPAFKQLIELQNECTLAKELNDGAYLQLKPLHIHKGLECQDVFFRYNVNQAGYTLQNINVSIPANQMTAVVGRSGAGKSTLIDLLMGLNKPERGQVCIDGIRLTDENILPFRRSISYVPQDPFLFNGTVKENLLIMAPNANESEMWKALEFSSAAEFVRKLPQGFDTVIGDRGIKLSGGERQRLVLARAILRKPSILVLDEATSALDTENEAKIQEALEKIKGTMTIIVIAHRLSTIRNADQVIVLDQGHIVQKGAYSHLAKEKNGLFSTFLENQIPEAKVLAAT